MPNDYQDNSIVVPVFTGINDVPRVPTATQAGNGSDIIARINNLLGFLDTDIADLDSRIATLESGGNSANLTVQLNNTDDILWVKYLPYFYNLGRSGSNMVNATQLDNANTIDLANVRYFDIANGDVLDLKNFIEFNGIGFYFFLSGTFGGVYNDASNTQQGNDVDLTFIENTAPKNVKILDFANLLADFTIDTVAWLDNVNGSNFYDPSGGYGGSSNAFMALEVQSVDFEFDFNITIG